MTKRNKTVEGMECKFVCGDMDENGLLRRPAEVDEMKRSGIE
jgi:hypothetical protein